MYSEKEALGTRLGNTSCAIGLKIRTRIQSISLAFRRLRRSGYGIVKSHYDLNISVVSGREIKLFLLTIDIQMTAFLKI